MERKRELRDTVAAGAEAAALSWASFCRCNVISGHQFQAGNPQLAANWSIGRDSRNSEHEQMRIRAGCETSVDSLPGRGIAKVVAHEKLGFAINILNRKFRRSRAVHFGGFVVREKHVLSVRIDGNQLANARVFDAGSLKDNAERPRARVAFGRINRKRYSRGLLINPIKAIVENGMAEIPVHQKILLRRLVGCQIGKIRRLLPYARCLLWITAGKQETQRKEKEAPLYRLLRGNKVFSFTARRVGFAACNHG